MLNRISDRINVEIMENELAAEQAGRVAAVHVTAGDTVEGGELLVDLE